MNLCPNFFGTRGTEVVVKGSKSECMNQVQSKLDLPLALE